jgi:hypothetical protein
MVFLMILAFMVFFLMFFEPTLVLFLSLSAVFEKSNPPPLLLCCVTNGLLPGGLELTNVLDGFS